MKSTILIFCLSLLATTNNAVIDTSGNEVLPDVDYYIRSVPPSPGSLTLRLRTNPGLTVALDESGRGSPVRFYPNVTLNEDLHVAFQVVDIPHWTEWKLRPGGDNIYVSIREHQSLADWFIIEEGLLPAVYKFAFGSDVDVGQDIISGNYLGLLTDQNGDKWLGLAELPYFFVIEKA